MKLTRASSYALHALVHLAHQPADKPVASHIVAEARGTPERFLLKVLKPLVSARILRSIKGPNGGYRLARPVKEISLLEVVEAVDGPIRGDAPPVGDDGGTPLDKKLGVVCQEAASLIRERFAKVTIADLAKGK
jgi:Rrf2 family protein